MTNGSSQPVLLPLPAALGLIPGCPACANGRPFPCRCAFGAAADGAHGYRIAPCCYYRGAAEGYRPLSREATLQLDGRSLVNVQIDDDVRKLIDHERLARLLARLRQRAVALEVAA